jgi:hypothetical protein
MEVGGQLAAVATYPRETISDSIYLTGGCTWITASLDMAVAKQKKSLLFCVSNTNVQTVDSYFTDWATHSSS